MIILLLGLGNIGKCLIKFLNKRNLIIRTVLVKKIKKIDVIFLKNSKNNYLLSHNYKKVKKLKFCCVIEVVGGTAIFKKIKNFIKKKPIITANKNLISIYYNRFYKKNLRLLFEASVGGGMQIIKNLNNINFLKLKKFVTIINGTTNFILTKIREGRDYKKAIYLSKKLGFSEKHNFFDINGLDIAFKVNIIINIFLNTKNEITKHFYIEKLKKSMINHKLLNKISKNFNLKYLGIFFKKKKILEIIISIFLVKNKIIKNFNNEDNVLNIEFKETGSMIFSGKGAGGKPTCASIFSDLLFLKRYKNGFFFRKNEESREIFFLNIIKKNILVINKKVIKNFIYKLRIKIIKKNKEFLILEKLNNKRFLYLRNFIKNKNFKNSIIYRIL